MERNNRSIDMWNWFLSKFHISGGTNNEPLCNKQTTGDWSNILVTQRYAHNVWQIIWNIYD